MLVDLHLHSTFSDGRYTPKELVQAAVKKHIEVIALTDHDSLNGCTEAIAEAERINAEVGKILIRVITGVELSTELDGKSIHILGYHLHTDCKEIIATLEELRYKREHRLEAIIEKCHAHGMDISMPINNPKARAVGRPHVAREMVAKGYVKTVQEAFDKYLHRGASCYVAQPKLSPKEAVEVIHKAGGVAVLAHPTELDSYELPEQLLSCYDFDGVEIWHPSILSKNDDLEHWLLLARDNGCMLSGGSDFHGIPGRFPEELGIWQVLYENTADIIEFRNKK